jgi:hypothetical protein
MTDKQKLAIKRLELNKNTEIYVDYKNNEKTDDIQEILDLLKEKDKQIDLMSEKIAFSYKVNCIEDIKTYKEQIKQYFEDRVKEEK